ncbi:VOC family protein [Paraglaciecola arctica]|uniref:PhnB protein n=1 Tax=Paraglaciecola arctica BSs20135 TaxID=493475 RepID=K6XGD4_9ALTE|nr:VOC family protein [Paraglaciecola arctica]GAC19714.1 PhnB protein [Paraglaciecola arctica BSs20135]
MKQLVPYLNFNGQCQDALHFYQSCFGNAELSIQTFADTRGEEMPKEMRDKVMHAEFKTDGLLFMASDGQVGGDFTKGNNMHLNVQLDSVEEQSVLFEKLSENGSVTMPLQQTFWDARFGMLTDKFGIQWMLNVMKTV